MTSSPVRVIALSIAMAACHPAIDSTQTKAASWLDVAKPVAWNKPGVPLPAAPRVDGNVDPRCRGMARPPELQEDKRLREKGWDLVGAYQGGWQILVIGATAGYDGMCRPLQYQSFVFQRGVFVGTLSPNAMDSRTDGALSQVYLQANDRVVAEYLRYNDADPLCCPSRTTSVEFEIASGPPVLRPLSATTSSM